MKPKIGEMWEIFEDVTVVCVKNVKKFKISGPGLIIDSHPKVSPVDLEDYYEVFWEGKVRHFYEYNFVRRYEGFDV